MNNDLINELYSKIDNQEKIIVDLQKNNSGITLEEHVRVLNAYQELQEKYNKQKEFIEYLEDEKDRLARECSQIYEDSLGKTRFVNENIFNEVNDILQKYKSIIGVSDEKEN